MGLTNNATQARGRGFFKFNSTLLKDNNYINIIKDTIMNFMEDNGQMTNKGLLWDCLKCLIRGKTISYSSAKAKQRNSCERELLRKIQSLEANLNEQNLDEYNSLKIDLEQIISLKAQGTMLRSKAKIIEENEKPTKFFLNQAN